MRKFLPQGMIVLAAVLFIVLPYWIIFYGLDWPTPGAREHGGHPQPEASQHKEESPANERGTLNAPLIVKMAPATHEETVANEKAENRGPKATRENLMVFFTGWLALVTTALAVYTAFLWTSTKRLVEGAEVSDRRKLRAYIGHMSKRSGAHFEEAQKRIPGIGVIPGPFGKVKYFDWNYGRTPALDVRMYVNITDEPPVPCDGDLPESCRKMVVQIVHPKQNIGRIVGDKTRDDTFFLYGYVQYTDIFGDKWRHRFAFDHNPTRRDEGGESWEAHHEHNDEQRYDKKTKAWMPLLPKET